MNVEFIAIIKKLSIILDNGILTCKRIHLHSPLDRMTMTNCFYIDMMDLELSKLQVNLKENIGMIFHIIHMFNDISIK